MITSEKNSTLYYLLEGNKQYIMNRWLRKIVRVQSTRKISNCLLLNLTTYKGIYFYGNCIQKILIHLSTIDLKFGFAI